MQACTHSGRIFLSFLFLILNEMLDVIHQAKEEQYETWEAIYNREMCDGDT